jgi:hypothetical protein
MLLLYEHMHVNPRLVFRNPCKTLFFSLCFHGQKKYRMLCFLWQYIRRRRRMRRKVQRGERREGKDGIEHKNKTLSLGREKTLKKATSLSLLNPSLSPISFSKKIIDYLPSKFPSFN